MNKKKSKNNKRVAVLGGGITGMTSAYRLAKKGYSVDLYEKDSFLGGLAAGFTQKNWDWPIEKAYHHLFATDTDIINFTKEIGFNELFFKEPKTDSLYKVGENNYRTIPVDSPQDFLLFPLLPMVDKIRSAFWLAYLKAFGFKREYEELTAEQYVRKRMGDKMWNVFFQQLFRKKFGKYAGNVLASFIWARINKRTKKLGYFKKGFQAFIDHLESECRRLGVSFHTGIEVTSIKKYVVNSSSKGGVNKFIINRQKYDFVVCTLPSPIIYRVAGDILSKKYLDRFSSLSYLHALVLLVETKKPILNDTYWLNICTEDIPLMFIGQHTNFIDKSHYGGNHLAYIGYYLERDDMLMSMTKEELWDYLLPYLKKINSIDYGLVNAYMFKGPFAQPIFNKKFIKSKPNFNNSGERNFFIANLDMTYPYDRGTNYAVKLGIEVSELIGETDRV